MDCALHARCLPLTARVPRVCNGTISANLNNALALSIANSGALTNTGTLEARNGGILTIAPVGVWSNAGLIKVVDATSSVNLGGTFSNAALGSFDNIAGGFLNLTGTLSNSGTLAFSAATGSMRLNGGTLSGGTVQFGGLAGALRSRPAVARPACAARQSRARRRSA